jgi:outer membrane protein assembly factor BamB
MAQHVPMTWSETENVAWKASIPGLGWSSPVTDGERIWLTTALEQGKRLVALCLDARTGDTTHTLEVFPDNDPKRIHRKNSHASPTPLIEGNHIYVHFGSYGTACLTQEGELLWRRTLPYAHGHGPGGSPVLFDDLLIVNCDGTDEQYVVALDKRTGSTRWQTPRAHVSEARRSGQKSPAMGFSTPLLVPTRGGEALVVSTGGDHVAAYDARSGQERWWCAYDGYSLVPRPVFGHGIVYVSTGYDDPSVLAIRLGGDGDVTQTHVEWTLRRGAPLNPSPLLVGNELYLVSDDGIATCVDAQTGRQHWQQRLGGSFSASPLVAEGRIYLLDEQGTTTVIAAGTTFRKLGTNSVTGRTLASLAAIDGSLFLRTDTHLYRIDSVSR